MATGFLLRHRTVRPFQYLMGTLDQPITQWVTNDYAKATVFPTADAAYAAQADLGEFSPLFEVVPRLEVVHA